MAQYFRKYIVINSISILYNGELFGQASKMNIKIK